MACFPKWRGVDAEGIGLTSSLCRPADDKHRTFSIDVNGRAFWTTDANFAGGKRIWMFTGGPAISWRPMYHLFSDHPKWDVVDLSGGVSVYRFRSDGFQTFSGSMVEGRATFHVTPAFRERAIQGRRWYARLLPELQVGTVGFLKGFEPGAFGKEQTRRIDGPDWVFPDLAINVDLGSIIR